MAYLRMKQLRPRLPEATRQSQTLVRSAYVDRAPADSDVSNARYILRPTTVPVVVVKRRHASPQ